MSNPFSQRISQIDRYKFPITPIDTFYNTDVVRFGVKPSSFACSWSWRQRILDRVHHREVLLRCDREKVRHLGQWAGLGQLEGPSSQRINPVQDQLLVLFSLMIDWESESAGRSAGRLQSGHPGMRFSA
jgi:hypothetical protein